MIPSIDITQWTPWAVLAYILIKDVLPKLFASIAPALSKRISTEDRLFSLMESNGEVLTKLNFALVKLCDTLVELEHRIANIEDNLNDNSSALRVASRLIQK